MSLVGPRPWPPSMVRDQVAAGLDYRNQVMPGWTGPVQVQKGVVEPAGYTKLDLAYVDASRRWSGLGSHATTWGSSGERSRCSPVAKA